VTVRNALFAVYALCCLGAMTWPGYARFGNSIEPYVLGLPFSFVWVVAWVVATFIVLLIYHNTGTRSG
jgi:hypothetical protein